MNHPDEIWRKLTTAARQVPAADTAAPYGFSGRVAARAWETRPVGSLLEHLAFRALGVAGLAAVLALATHLSVPSVGASDDASFFSMEDPAAIVLGVNDDE